MKNQDGCPQPEVRLSGVLETITDGFLLIDRDYRIRYWNRHAEKMLQRSCSEVVGRSLWAVFPEEWGRAFHRQYEQALHTGSTTRFVEYYARRQQWLEVTIYPNEEGLSIFFRDVTGNRLAEEELISGKAEYRKLFQNAPLPQLIYELETMRIVKANDAVTQLYGYTQEELIGMSVFRFRPESEYAKLQDYVARLTEEDQRYISHWTHLKKDGTPMTVETTAIRTRYEGRVCVLVSILDITERLRLDEKFTRLRMQAQQQIAQAQLRAQEGEREVIGRELHDNINQLLTAAKLQLEFALDNPASTEALVRRSAVILQEAITEIRGLSKTLVTPVMRDVGFATALDELLETYRSAQAFELKFQCAEGHLPEEIALTFYRILQEGLTNIIKYAGATTVHIDIHIDPDGFRLYLRDNGKGFDTKAKRNGVGLTNIRHRVEIFNGQLQVRSAPGQGCTLMVHIPQPHSFDGEAAETAYTILVAEDDADDRELLGEAFRQVAPQHQIRFVEDGSSLLQQLESLPDGQLPQLLVVDYDMPRINGLDALMRLQTDHRYRTLLKILYTTAPGESFRSHPHSASATAIISKGHTIDEVRENVRQMLGYCR